MSSLLLYNPLLWVVSRSSYYLPTLCLLTLCFVCGQSRAGPWSTIHLLLKQLRNSECGEWNCEMPVLLLLNAYCPNPHQEMNGCIARLRKCRVNVSNTKLYLNTFMCCNSYVREMVNKSVDFDINKTLLHAN